MRRWLQVLATVVTVVLAVLVVVGLMASRGIHPPATPESTPGATPAAAHDFGDPPADVNLLYVHDPNRPDWLTAFDWTGTPRGTVKPTGGDAAKMSMAPDGQSFSQGLDAKGGSWQFFDRLGRLRNAFGMTSQPPYNTMWSDDSRHVCAMTLDPATYAYTFWIMEVGLGATPVTEVARDTGLGQSIISLVACSVLNDRVIAVRITGMSPTELWVLQESDGKVLSHHIYDPGALSQVVASTDGQYIAETAYDGSSTQVRRVADWSVVATIGKATVIRFSGDDSRVLIGQQDVQGRVQAPAVVEWQTGQLVWQDDPGPAFLGRYIAEPGGSSFAIAHPTSDQYPSPANIVIVDGAGAATKLDRLYAPAW